MLSNNQQQISNMKTVMFFPCFKEIQDAKQQFTTSKQQIKDIIIYKSHY